MKSIRIYLFLKKEVVSMFELLYSEKRLTLELTYLREKKDGLFPTKN